jgi:predicted MFS family arabinose efflux permease
VVGAALGNVALAAAITVLGPIVADRELGGAAAWGAIVAGEGVGFVLGGLLALRLRPRRPLKVAMLGVLASACLFPLLAAGAPIPLIVAGAVVSGIGLELFGVLWDTTLQQHVPHDRLSRVSAWDQLGSFVAIPVGLSIVGPIADTIGVSETLLLFAGILVIPNALVLLSREVRQLEAQPESSIALREASR